MMKVEPAKSSLRDKIRADGISRQAQHQMWDILIQAAHEAGLAAGINCKPMPMTVKDESSGQRWHVSEGMCGFGWVHIYPGQRKFLNYLKARSLGYAAYGGGWDINCFEFNQSVDRKDAYCRAYANVLRDGGIRCDARSRLD